MADQETSRRWAWGATGMRELDVPGSVLGRPVVAYVREDDYLRERDALREDLVQALAGRLQAERQRDALADALLPLWELFAIGGAPPDMYRDCATDGQRLGAATAWDWVHAKVKPVVESALRLAGRLP